MWRKIATGLVPAFIFVAVTACAQSADRRSSDDEAAQDVRKPVTYREHSDPASISPGDPSAATDPGKAPQDLLSRIGQDLAQRLGVKVSALQVVSVESVVWNDGSLGCPQPDQSYIAAQVPGSRVLLQHAGKTYQYHASERGQFVYCANPSEPAGALDRQ